MRTRHVHSRLSVISIAKVRNVHSQRLPSPSQLNRQVDLLAAPPTLVVVEIGCIYNSFDL